MFAPADQYGLFHERYSMINDLREYILTVTAGAILCSLVQNMLGKGFFSASMLRILCGVFMACLLIRPLVRIDFSSILFSIDSYTSDANAAVSVGEAAAKESMQAVIKSKTEEYILDKAAALNAELDVQVTLNDMVPAKVALSGAVSPYTRSVLGSWITQQLGIPKEAQIWTLE